MKAHYRLSLRQSLLVAVFLAATGLFLSNSDARIFTSEKDGRTVDGEIKGVTTEAVRLQIGTRQVEIPLTALIEADRRYIELWKKEQAKSKIPDLEVHVNTGLNKRRDPSYSYYYSYYDASFDFKVRIENDERDFLIENATGILAVIGENCVRSRDDYVVMQKENFPITVEGGETFEWKGPEVQFRYAEGSGYQYGYKYHSYILQIKNASGKVIFTKVMAPRFSDFSEEILKHEEEAKFGKDGKAVKGSRSSSGTKVFN